MPLTRQTYDAYIRRRLSHFLQGEELDAAFAGQYPKPRDFAARELHFRGVALPCKLDNRTYSADELDTIVAAAKILGLIEEPRIPEHGILMGDAGFTFPGV